MKGVEDFTGDGIPDVIAGTSNFDKNPARLYGIDGANGHVVYYQSSEAAMALHQIKDITGDGIPDIAVAGLNASAFGCPWYATLSLVDVTTGDQQCWADKGCTYLTMRMEDISLNPDDTTLRLLFSGCQGINVTGVPSCWSDWTFPAWIATSAGDLTGDSVNDVLCSTYHQSGKADTVFYVDGKTGMQLASFSFDNNVFMAEPFPDITGDGYRETILGGTGFLYCLAGSKANSIGIDESTILTQKSMMTIYPNPASRDLFIVSRDGTVVEEVAVYNQIGQKVLHKQPVIQPLDISRLHPGIYVIEMFLNDTRYTEKLVIR